MSLDLEHLTRNGPSLNIGYRSFAEYRRLLARDAAAINLDEMRGFGGERDWPDREVQPLGYLLRHSDAEGWLHQCECESLRPVMVAFRPPLTWPSWASDYHGQLTTMIGNCADEGGVIRFH